MATAREGRGERRGRRCTKPAGSDAAARPRRLQRRPPTAQICETSTQQPTEQVAHKACGRERKHRARISKGGAGPGAEERAGDALARARKGKMQGRDRAGAEECPGATPAYRLMGWRAGIPPPGDDRGERESCKGRDGHAVAGANLAYLLLLLRTEIFLWMVLADSKYLSQRFGSSRRIVECGAKGAFWGRVIFLDGHGDPLLLLEIMLELFS